MFASFKIPKHIKERACDAFIASARTASTKSFVLLNCNGEVFRSFEPDRRLSSSQILLDELCYYGEPEWFQASIISVVSGDGNVDALQPFVDALCVIT